MASFIFNIAKGRTRTLAELSAANDALVAIPIEASGVEGDATVIDYDTVAAVLAASTNEQLTMGRQVLTGVTVTVNDTNDRVDIDCGDITWTAATGNPISDLMIVYVPDLGVSTDSAMIPMAWCDFPITPDGSNVVANVSDIMRSA